MCNLKFDSDQATTANSSNYVLAALSGLMLSLPFSFPGLYFVAWFALVPLFISLNGASGLTAFKLGWSCGFFHFLSLLYWLVVAVGHYGNLGAIIGVGPLLLLCIYLAIYPGFFSLGVTLLKHTPLLGLTHASLWVFTEFLRAKVLTGFPWCLVGYSQHSCLKTIQIANLAGVYGISFLILIVNYVLFKIVTSKRKTLKDNSVKGIVTLGTILFFILFYGNYSLNKTHTQTKNANYLNVLVVQPNIDQSKKWDPSFQQKTMDILLSLSKNITDFHPDLIVWPETATPFFFQDNKTFSSKIIDLVNKSEVPLIFGSPAYESTQQEFKYLNRAYLLIPGEQTHPFYDKMHLVPFGEYIPFENYLFFIGKLVQGAGNFQPGNNPKPLEYGNLRYGILICFEAIFPEMARKRHEMGANLLINITNDAWFGNTTAPYQHLAMAVFRAVENRLSMVRAANTGISAFIGPDGNILNRSHIFKRQILKYRIPLMDSCRPTVYSQLGDFLPLSISIFIISLIMYRLVVRWGANSDFMKKNKGK